MRPTTTALAALLLASSAAAQSPLTLDCRYARTLDATTMKSEAMGGGFSAVVRFGESAPGRPAVSIETTKSGPCAAFGGAPTELEINGRCETQMPVGGGFRKVVRTISINRVSGAFEEHLTIGEGAGLIHYGQCAAARRQF